MFQWLSMIGGNICHNSRLIPFSFSCFPEHRLRRLRRSPVEGGGGGEGAEQGDRSPRYGGLLPLIRVPINIVPVR